MKFLQISGGEPPTPRWSQTSLCRDPLGYFRTRPLPLQLRHSWELIIQRIVFHIRYSYRIFTSTVRVVSHRISLPLVCSSRMRKAQYAGVLYQQIFSSNSSLKSKEVNLHYFWFCAFQRGLQNRSPKRIILLQTDDQKWNCSALKIRRSRPHE